MYVVGINHSQERGKEARKGKGALKGSYERKDGKESRKEKVVFTCMW